jgi:hypothetical protein
MMHSSSSASIMKLLFISAAVLSTLSSSWLPQASAFSTTTPSSSYNIIQNSKSLLDPISGTVPSSPIISNNLEEENNKKKKKSLVVLLPQLGEFDSSEYIEYLLAAESALTANNINLYIIGIGNAIAASNFCKFTNLNSNNNNKQQLYIDPNGTLYKELGLYAGPEFRVPNWVSDDVCKFFLRQLPGGVPSDDDEIRDVSTAWLNYMGEHCFLMLYTHYIHDIWPLLLTLTLLSSLFICRKHTKISQPCVQE